MRGEKLLARENSADGLATVFAGGLSASISIQEDVCFESSAWLPLGKITLKPDLSEGSDPELRADAVQRAITHGAYHWDVPPYRQIVDSCNSLLENKTPKGAKPTPNAQALASWESKLLRAIEAIGHIPLRCGLRPPLFDPDALSTFPFQRPTTLVFDVNAILQGALDFACDSLYPMARIKVPAIAQMELLNQSHRYITQRRKHKATPGTLLDHFTSQGGQRVLLRLEFQSDVEVERARLGADPLRGIVQVDDDAEDRALGLHIIQKTFADRLILETVIQHRERANPSHDLALVTGDHGLAKMTMAEGIRVIYMHSHPAESLFGCRYFGTSFKPFRMAGTPALAYVPLPKLLWELAASCGAVRIESEDKLSHEEVHAIGENFRWSAHHALDDLLWVRAAGPPATPATALESAITAPPAGILPSMTTGRKLRRSKDVTPGNLVAGIVKAPSPPAERTINFQPALAPTLKAAKPGFARFTLEKLLKLITILHRDRTITQAELMAVVETTSPNQSREYVRFLSSAQCVFESADSILEAGPQLDKLYAALRARDYPEIQVRLRQAPSFDWFLSQTPKSTPKLRTDYNMRSGAQSSYCALAMLAATALEIAGEGVVLTSNHPAPADFVPLALDAYETVRGGRELAFTGAWLEEMARRHGVHPVISKLVLETAHAQKLIERFTEGATPDWQHESHSMPVLTVVDGEPVAQKVHLYHGDFIIKERSSVSIRFKLPTV